MNSFESLSRQSDLAAIGNIEGSRGMVVSSLWLPERTMNHQQRRTPGTSSNYFERWQHPWPCRASSNLVFVNVCKGLRRYRHK